MKLFFLISFIGFFFPYLLQFSLNSQNIDLKLLAIYLLPKFNFTYFAIIILFFFLGLKKKFARYAQIIFILIYIGFTLVDYYFITQIKIQEALNKYNNQNVKVVKIKELKNIKNFQLLYKRAYLAIIKEKKTDHTNPFGYKKDRRE